MLPRACGGGATVLSPPCESCLMLSLVSLRLRSIVQLRLNMDGTIRIDIFEILCALVVV